MSGLDVVEIEIDKTAELNVVTELARLPPLEYDQQREAIAKELKVRVKTLDEEVGKLRSIEAEEHADQVIEEISPWAEAVDGAELLNKIERTFRRHCVMQNHDYQVLPLLVLGSYCFDAFSVFPKALVKSPEKRCGKTVVLEVAESMVYRGMMASSISASSIFRVIDAHHPTLIIDEADAFMVGNEEMRGIINSSHRRRNAFVVRTEKVGDEFIPRKFTTWAPMFIAGIGQQADTIEDRSIIIELRRKLASEKVAKCPVALFEKMINLRRQCLRWAEDHSNTLKLTDFEMPDCGNDRAADNWFPLFAIASLVGEPWASRVLTAYTNKNSTTEDEAIGVMLLKDIRTIFDEKHWLKLHSETIVEHLVDMEDRPWPEWKHGKPMTKTSLNKLLKPYKIKSKQIRIANVNRYGFQRSQFEDAWKRYASHETGVESTSTPFQNATTLHPLLHKALLGIQNATDTPCVAFLKSLKPLQDGACSDVAFSEGGTTDPIPQVDW